jgi:long-chain acyl-CoA synthetase
MDAEAVNAAIRGFIDDFNKNQPTYRQITSLVIRKNPFARNATSKIIRAKALEDIPA